MSDQLASLCGHCVHNGSRIVPGEQGCSIPDAFVDLPLPLRAGRLLPRCVTSKIGSRDAGYFLQLPSDRGLLTCGLGKTLLPASGRGYGFHPISGKPGNTPPRLLDQALDKAIVERQIDQRLKRIIRFGQA